MPEMAPRLDAATFERMLLDPDTPDEAIRPYVVESAGEAGAFRPVVRANPALVEAPETEAAVALASLNGIARWRRQRRYRRKLQGWTGLRLVSEGDSWFQYPFLLTDVIDWLSTPYAILSLDAAGDLLSDMVRQGELLTAVVEERPHAVLLSGGGNDLLGGSNLARALLRFEPGRAPAAYLGAGFEANLRAVLGDYERLFDRVSRVAPGTRVLTHVYDYAIPAGGRWLGRPMRELGIEDTALQRDIVRVIVDRFEAGLRRLAGTFTQVRVIDTRDLVGAGRWHDELHPTDEGYRAVAERFAAAIGEATDTPAPQIDAATEAASAEAADAGTSLDRHGEAALLREIGRRAALAEAGDPLADAPPFVFPSSVEGVFPELMARGEKIVTAVARDASDLYTAGEIEIATRGDPTTLARRLEGRAGSAGAGQALLVATVMARRLRAAGGAARRSDPAAMAGSG